jgi:hypothetical protein
LSRQRQQRLPATSSEMRLFLWPSESWACEAEFIAPSA